MLHCRNNSVLVSSSHSNSGTTSLLLELFATACLMLKKTNYKKGEDWNRLLAPSRISIVELESFCSLLCIKPLGQLT